MVADGAKVQGWTAWLNGNFVEVADENGQKKKSGTLVLALRFIVGLVAWSPANLAFLFDFDQSCYPKTLPDKRFTNAGGEKASVVPALE